MHYDYHNAKVNFVQNNPIVIIFRIDPFLVFPIEINVNGYMMSTIFGGQNNDHAIITCIGRSIQLYKEIVNL